MCFGLELSPSEGRQNERVCSLLHSSPPKSKPAWVGVVESGTGPSFLAKRTRDGLPSHCPSEGMNPFFYPHRLEHITKEQIFFVERYFPPHWKRLNMFPPHWKRIIVVVRTTHTLPKYFPPSALCHFYWFFFNQNKRKKNMWPHNNDIITVVVTGVLCGVGSFILWDCCCCCCVCSCCKSFSFVFFCFLPLSAGFSSYDWYHLLSSAGVLCGYRPQSKSWTFFPFRPALACVGRSVLFCVPCLQR